MDTETFEIFPWNHEFLTHIPKVDHQHRHLVDLINRLARTVLEGTDETTADEIVAELRDYARYHFETEEGIWEQAFRDDEWFNDHCRAHAGFVEELNRIAALQGPEEYRLQPLLEFLVRWLTLHILRSDKQMAAAISAIDAGMGIADARERARRHLRDRSSESLDSLLNMYLGVERQVTEFAKQLASRGQTEAENHFRTLFESFIHPLFLVAAKNGRIVNANSAAATLLGRSTNALCGQRLTDLHPQAERERVSSRLVDLNHTDAQRQSIYSRIQTSDEREVPVRITCGGEIGAREERLRIAFYEDMTHELEHRHELEWRSFNDHLTGLPNRAGVMRALEETAGANDAPLAVVSIDLDAFGALNERLGTHNGDQVLVHLARRWCETLNPGTLIGRLGGDEFILVLRDTKSIAELDQIMETVVDAGNAIPISGGETVDVRVSAGVSVRPPRRTLDPDTMLRQADHALYEVKLRGQQRWDYFDHRQYEQMAGQNRMINALRGALENHELVLEYQPKVNMRTGEVLGVEALVRWDHPTHGRLPPGEFLPAIEKDPVSVDLGEFVLEKALQQMEAWRERGLKLQVSVNIGAMQLEAQDFATRLEDILDQHPQIPREDLEIEVLESTAFDNPDAAETSMQAARRVGVAMSIDDFGTGYSSLTYIKRVPATVLKMDRSYVEHMLDDADDRAIVEAVLALAQTFNRQVIAEGVETVEQGRALLAMGCENGQGYAIARPMPPDTLAGWLEHWTPPPEWSNAPSPHTTEYAESRFLP
ncbi:EAL domain-containing protein [Thioalkalivibrio sp. ALE9]|uniref:EAL domain-containing protein n=1 Tax=Thioalkalivibrio sp. ALE9 TaxID=1158169 RepID=UPI00035E16B8|nr:EAL domain-containing protein [Thioalkalivibrio sp. ALE9]